MLDFTVYQLNLVAKPRNFSRNLGVDSGLLVEEISELLLESLKSISDFISIYTKTLH